MDFGRLLDEERAAGRAEEQRRHVAFVQRQSAAEFRKAEQLRNEHNFDWAIHFQEESATWYAGARKAYEEYIRERSG